MFAYLEILCAGSSSSVKHLYGRLGLVVTKVLLPAMSTSLWFTPAIAQQCRTAMYIALAVVTAWLYDFVLAIPEEVRMFMETPVTLADIAYICARFFTAGCVSGTLIFAVSSSNLCNTLLAVVTWFGALALPSNSLLFLIRVKGIFHNSRSVVILFGLLWTTTFLSFSAPFSYVANNEEALGVEWCWVPRISALGSAPFIALAIFDTAVFIAISMRVISYSPAHTWNEKFKSFIFGKNLGHISRALLRSGQLYYMVTVTINICIAAVVLSPSISPIISATTAIVNIALQNIMACRVFRLLKFGLIEDDSSAPTFFQMHISRKAAHLSLLEMSSSDTIQQCTMDMEGMEDEHDVSVVVSSGNRALRSAAPLAPVEISITQETEVVVDAVEGSQLGDHV
ncbi:unnamed protein product [Somion occarium]